MKVEQIKLNNALINFNYILYDEKERVAWVVDPYDAKRIVTFLADKNLTLKGIFNTHQHFDHIKGNNELQERFGCPLTKTHFEGSFQLIDDYSFRSLSVPGHTLEHIVFYLYKKESQVALFSGDTLFHNGVGNCKNGGDISKLYQSILKVIDATTEETIIYPGHDYILSNLKFSGSIWEANNDIQNEFEIAEKETTRPDDRYRFKRELRTNIFLNFSNDSLKNEIEKKFQIQIKSDEDCFKILRSLRDKW